MQRSGALVLAALLVLSLVAVTPASAHINDVSADAQVSPDGTVVAESAYVASDGWIAVFADADHTEVLGFRKLAADGFQTDVTVTIDAEHWAEFDERTVHVALLGSDDDGEFEPGEDDQVLTTFGRQASEAVPLRKGPRALVTEEAFAPDWVNESTLELRRVTLPEAGHVVVRNASTGTVLGSTALAAGTHESVNVTLDEAAAFDGDGDYRLRATLHGDDGDDTYRASDPGVTANGTVVSTRFRVRRSGLATGTVPPTTSVGAGTATGAGTPTPTESFVNTPTASPTPTAADGTPGDTVGGTDTAGDGPGFGLVAAVAGLAGTALLARRRGRRGGER
ncbi:PGF-CTERM sorting domain-containing protein [Salinirubellus salinus]|jgi:PGF-CTERM protein|uniref:PGF-CTERM sorting domain-containing protein n=1 Tax=Salinirubellus salinus TaxID=1364945 RepID=A0A9E7R3M3_9EURY|nr:PGF-CTERM sorting domain-containing protein [Salinirubellus salinus]UWM54173.1 PGF-CTERM sorting domain-containing protein [Salinirubellus salinus]